MKRHYTRHGGYYTPEYKTWGSMISRCTNPKSLEYRRYGGRGIKVCDRWRRFENFREDMGPRPPGTSIDRIDNDGDYCPGNTRWTTRAVQNRNTHRTRLFTIGSVTKCLTDWSRETGIAYETLRSRIKSGMAIERALTRPIGRWVS